MTTDPPRARSFLETAREYAISVEITTIVTAIITYLGRLGADPTNAEWAAELRRGLALSYEAGDTRVVLMHVDLYAQALAATDRAEVAAQLTASVAELSLHMSNPVSVSHRRVTNERLLSRLGNERLGELTSRGATLGYEEMVALASTELDRVIAHGKNG
jgi:hypothetical protein